MYQCILTEDQAKQTQCVLQKDYNVICILVGTEFLIQDGLLEIFLHYTREWSHVPGCVSYSLAAVLCSTPPPFAFNMLSPFTLQNMLSADIFSLKKNGPLCGLSFKLFQCHFFCFVLDYCFVIQLNNLPIFFLFSSCWSVKTIWISKKWKIVTLANIFFLAEIDLQKQFPDKRTHRSLHIFRHISETNRKALLIGISATLLTSLVKERNTENILSLSYKLISTNKNELFSK